MTRLSRMTAALVMAVAAGTATAQTDEWKRLTGDDVRSAVVSRTLVYGDGSTEEYRADGTLAITQAGPPALGAWMVSRDALCVRFPPAVQWTCYVLERQDGGIDLRFRGPNGTVSIGRYADL